MGKRSIQAVFGLSALYDLILGLIFLLIPLQIYNFFTIPPPNHWGYVHFPALLLMIFALMFFAIAWNPLQNRNLIPYGVLFKFSYSGVVLYYWIASGLPHLWKPFAIVDAVMAILFIWAYVKLTDPDIQEELEE
jgi:hypothetical protein